MDSTCRIFYDGPRGTLNATTGVESPTEVDRIASTPCRFHANPGTSNASETAPASSLGSRLTREVSIGVGSATVKVGDFLELLTVGPLTDASLAGIRWRIIDPGQTAQATARRMLVEVDK